MRLNLAICEPESNHRKVVIYASKIQTVLKLRVIRAFKRAMCFYMMKPTVKISL